MVDPSGLLMIEPSSRVSAEPIVDELTRKMTAAWRARSWVDSSNGKHQCACGARSDDSGWQVGSEPGLITNSLCVHYLAYHRDEVPPNELAKVRALGNGETEPTTTELCPQPPTHQKKLARVPNNLRELLAGITLAEPLNWTALDGFLNDGHMMGIALARLRVPEAELGRFFEGLANVWDPPDGGFINRVRVKVRTPEGKTEKVVDIEVWPEWQRK